MEHLNTGLEKLKIEHPEVFTSGTNRNVNNDLDDLKEGVERLSKSTREAKANMQKLIERMTSLEKDKGYKASK